MITARGVTLVLTIGKRNPVKIPFGNYSVLLHR